MEKFTKATDQDGHLGQALPQIKGSGDTLILPTMLIQVQDQHGQTAWRISGGVLSTDTPVDTLKLHSRKQLLVFLLPDSTEYLAPLDAVLDAYQPAETPPATSGEDLFFVPMGAAAPPPPTGWDKPTPQPHFYLYDHLGNTRVLFHARSGCAESDTIVLDYVGDYYPYGKTLREFIPAGDVRERYLTTQHERDAESGGLDNRGARWFDSDVCRFLSVDTLAQKHSSWSPYNYVLQNPIKLIDPMGRDTSSPSVMSSLTDAWNNYSFHFDLNMKVTAGGQIGGDVTLGKSSLGAHVNIASVDVFSMSAAVDGLTNPSPSFQMTHIGKNGSANVSQGFGAGIGLFSTETEKTFTGDLHGGGSSNSSTSNEFMAGIGPLGVKSTTQTTPSSNSRSTQNSALMEVSIDLRWFFGVKIESNIGFTSNR